MAYPKKDRCKVIRLRPRRTAVLRTDSHAWMVPHLISLIRYAEANGLRVAEHALIEATEMIAPTVHASKRPRRAPRAQSDAVSAQIVRLTDLRPS